MFFQSILSIIAKNELMVKKHHPLLLLIFSVFFFVVSCAKEKFSQGSFVIQDSVTTKALLQNETAGNSMSVSSNWNAYAYGKAIHYNLVPGSLYIE